MDMTMIENLDKMQLEKPAFDRFDLMKSLNPFFPTLYPSDVVYYGITENDKGHGLVEKLSRNELGHVRKDYYQDGVHVKTREKIADNTWKVTRYDDKGTAYLSETSIKGTGTNTVVSHSYDLAPNAEIVKGNFTVKTDSLGRPISNKITDLQICEGRERLSQRLKDGTYKEGDQIGHLIADIFGGPASKENVVPQLSEVNQSQFKRLENHIRRLKEAGHKVDYEVKTNYVGKDPRPSSFEFKITVDGKPYDLDGDLKSLRKIYNANLDSMEKTVITAKENITVLHHVTSSMHKAGFEQGLEAAKLTFAISTVDNAVSYVSGEITAEEMVSNIAKDTGTAGVIGYGTGFISKGVAMGLEKSGKEMLRSLGKTSIPTAAIAFGVESYDSIMSFAQGEIDGVELAYDLGDNAASTAGGMIGAKVGAAVGTAIVPGAGTVIGGTAGSLIGGMVGCAIASGAYETAVETGSSTATALGSKLEQVANETIDYANTYMPESADIIKESINNFVSTNNLPFHF